jgi:hypothetical protein
MTKIAKLYLSAAAVVVIALSGILVRVTRPPAEKFRFAVESAALRPTEDLRSRRDLAAHKNDADPTSTVRAHIRIADLSGAKLSSFFEGLPTNAKIREGLLHGKPSRTACKQNAGVISRIMSALGLGNIVHAQNPCTDPGCNAGGTSGCWVIVQNVVCTECGSGMKTAWYADFLNNRGWRETGSAACGNAVCGCNVNECICL